MRVQLLEKESLCALNGFAVPKHIIKKNWDDIQLDYDRILHILGEENQR